MCIYYIYQTSIFNICHFLLYHKIKLYHNKSWQRAKCSKFESRVLISFFFLSKEGWLLVHVELIVVWKPHQMLNTRWPLAGECLVHCNRRSLLGCWFSGNQFVIISWCIASRRGWANRTYPHHPLVIWEAQSSCPPYIPLTEVQMWTVPPGLQVCFQDCSALQWCSRLTHSGKTEGEAPIPSELSFHGACGMARHHIETALAALPVNWKPLSQTLYETKEA